MEKIIKVLLYIILVAAVIAASTFFYADSIYHAMVAEDGLFEYLTALILLAISVFSLVRVLKTGKSRNVYWLVFNMLIIIGAFFGFGEEVSWGQRIFSIDSGDFFIQNNLQNETNLHNLEVGGVNLNKLFSSGLVVVFGTYFILTQFLYKRIPFIKNLIDLFGVQIPRIKHSILMLACTGFVLLIPELRIWELWEAIFVALLLLVFIDPVNEKEKLFV